MRARACLGRCEKHKQELNFKSRRNANKNDIYLFSSWHFIAVISLTWGPLGRESREWPTGNEWRRLHILVSHVNKAYLIGILCICLTMSLFPEELCDTCFINIFLFSSSGSFPCWECWCQTILLFLILTNKFPVENSSNATNTNEFITVPFLDCLHFSAVYKASG